MKVKLLSQRRADADRRERLRALFEGGPRWHAMRAAWFPQRGVEPKEVYDERLALLTYTNHVGGLLSTLVGLLFAEPAVVEGLGAEAAGSADFYARLLADADGVGTGWAELWPPLVEDALVARHAYLWLDPPAAAPGAAWSSLGDQLRAGALDVRLHRIPPEQVLDWGEGPGGELRWLLFVGDTEERGAPEQARARVRTWTYIDAKQVRRWEWRPREDQGEPGPEDEAVELAAVAHGFGQLPVVRLSLPLNLWAMHRLEDVAVKLTRSENELAWALHQAAHELLVIRSREFAADTPKLGHGHYLHLERDVNGADDAKYVAPSGVAFQHLRAERDADRADLFRAVQAMAQAVNPEHAQAQSGASKNADWKAADVLLTALSGRVLGAMRRTLELVAAVRQDKVQPVVRGLDGWHVEDLETFLRSATMAVDAARLSPTFRRLLARVQAERVLGAAVRPEELDQVRAEIDGATDDDPDGDGLDPAAAFDRRRAGAP
jgi:hypothetical protein